MDVRWEVCLQLYRGCCLNVGRFTPKKGFVVCLVRLFIGLLLLMVHVFTPGTPGKLKPPRKKDVQKSPFQHPNKDQPCSM